MKKGSLGWGSLVCVAWLCLVFAHGLGGEADAEFLEDFAVYFAGHHGGVHLAAVEKRQAVEGAAAVVVEETEDGERDQHLVGV